MQDVDEKPIAGFAIDACPWIYGDSLERTVEWQDGNEVKTDVSSLSGSVIRLVFELKDADLFAFRFQ